MDNNNPVSTPPPTAPPPQKPVAAPPEGGGENKQLIFWLIGGLMVIVLVVGGIYWYLSKQNAESNQQAETSAPAVTQNKEDLESDINDIKVDDVDADFTQVDKDIQNL